AELRHPCCGGRQFQKQRIQGSHSNASPSGPTKKLQWACMARGKQKQEHSELDPQYSNWSKFPPLMIHSALPYSQKGMESYG
ncbi:hypothetical protein A2U01_0049968, partial [Trifolium medium]|nr:hypothetical protein [Trifolium medium]